MLRRHVTLVLLAAAVLAPADAVAGHAQGKKGGFAKVLECRTGDTGQSGSATFLGRVLATPGSDRMAMRFTLLERFGVERRRVVHVPALRAWHYSKPGIRDFRHKQTVTGLQAGGEYRVRVDFRWYDSAGKVVRQSRRTSRACRQQGDLANLLPGLPTAGSGPEGTAVYTVPVRNTGKAPAKDVAVELFVDGAATNVGHIDAIAPGEVREVRFTGPVCQRALRVVVDPSDAVKERRESDNAKKFGCAPRPR